MTGESASSLGWASLQSLGYGARTKVLCKHLVILGKVERGWVSLQCCMAMLTRGAPEKSAQHDALCLELAFLLWWCSAFYIAAMHKNAWRIGEFRAHYSNDTVRCRWVWKNLLQLQS